MGDGLPKYLQVVGRRIVLANVARATVGGTFVAAAACIVRAVGSATSVAAPPIWVAFLALPVAAIVGFARRRSTTLAIAAGVDRDLELRELLSSAIAVRHRDDPASQTIVAMAEGVVSGIDPSRVSVGMPSANAAAAGGLTLLLAFAMASLASSSMRTRLAPPPAAGTVTAGATSSSQASADVGRAIPMVEVDARRSQPRTSAEEPTEGSHDAVAQWRNATPHGTVAADAAGRSTASTPDREAAGEMIFAAGRQPNETTQEGVASTSAGPREDARNRSGSADASRRDGTLERPALPMAPRFDPIAAREQARIAIDRGVVPVDCRDLVRAYFDVPVTSERAGATR